MSVLGFHEAYQNTITARLASNVDILVISLASIALLKILVWDERHLIFPKKDAHDFALIARHYTDAGSQDRLYEEFSHLVDAPNFSYELTGARMLGYDIGMIFNGQSRTLAASILQRENEAQWKLAFISAMPMEAEEALLLVDNVAKGLNDSIAPV